MYCLGQTWRKRGGRQRGRCGDKRNAEETRGRGNPKRDMKNGNHELINGSQFLYLLA